MSALDYRNRVQPSGTLRLSSSDDWVPHRITKFKPAQKSWTDIVKAVVDYPTDRPPAYVTANPIDFAYAHSGLKTPDGHSVPVVTDVPGHAPVLDLQPLSDRLKPNDATIVQTNQNGAMEPKLPQDTYIHISNPTTTIPLNTVIPHDGPPLTELQKRIHLDTIVPAVYDAIKRAVGYVIWNYEDLYNQFRLWDGSPLNLFRDMHFVWRCMVSAVITLGLIEIVPLLESLFSLWWDFMSLVYHAFVFAGHAVSEVIHFLVLLWDDADALWFKLTGK